MRFTTRDLECLPDPLDDTRYDIIDGELYVTKQPRWQHQYGVLQRVSDPAHPA